MPYSIKFNDKQPGIKHAEELAWAVKLRLQEELAKDGRFRCVLGQMKRDTSRPREGTREYGYTFTLDTIRLTKAKPYCGQHPGECEVIPGRPPRKKPNMTLLEWDDWVEFNHLINRVLDSFKASADVGSNPIGVKGRMWIRRGLKRRTAYLWDDHYDRGRRVQIWDRGVEDTYFATLAL